MGKLRSKETDHILGSPNWGEAKFRYILRSVWHLQNKHCYLHTLLTPVSQAAPSWGSLLVM